MTMLSINKYSKVNIAYKEQTLEITSNKILLNCKKKKLSRKDWYVTNLLGPRTRRGGVTLLHTLLYSILVP